jgi:S1-C subfamily serine protease
VHQEEPPRIFSTLALIAATLLLISYFGIKYAPKFSSFVEPLQALSKRQRSAPAAGTVQSNPRLEPTGNPSLGSEARKLTAEEVYQSAAPAVVLLQNLDEEGHPRAQGSGFVASADGLVVTNYHVVRGAYQAIATFADGSIAPVTGIVGYDRSQDVAVLQLARSAPAYLAFGDSNDVRVGQQVFAIGSPHGLQNTLSEGNVSGVGGVRGGMIQLDAPISPGSSGGPILNAEGRVVGIAEAFVPGAQNLNFAVPINWATKYFDGSAARALSEVAAENTVTNQIVSQSLTIPAGQVAPWQFTIDSNKMSNAEVQGEVSSAGGLDGKITLSVLSLGAVSVYSCRATYCAIHQDFSQDGTYSVILDNRMSLLFSRNVTAQITLRYVK